MYLLDLSGITFSSAETIMQLEIPGFSRKIKDSATITHQSHNLL